LSSCNGVYQLIMQSDGNLVIYQNGGAIWATGTNQYGTGGNPDAAVMQSDGNFVIYNYQNFPNNDWRYVWDTGTNGNPGAVLGLRSDGNLMVIAPNGAVLWQSGT
jgi:hypothetical protein